MHMVYHSSIAKGARFGLMGQKADTSAGKDKRSLMGMFKTVNTRRAAALILTLVMVLTAGMAFTAGNAMASTESKAFAAAAVAYVAPDLSEIAEGTISQPYTAKEDTTKDAGKAAKETKKEAVGPTEKQYYEVQLGGISFAKFEYEEDAQAVIDGVVANLSTGDETLSVDIQPALTVETITVDTKKEKMPKFEDEIDRTVGRILGGDDAGFVYTTNDEDTFWSIAENFGVDVGALMEANPDIDPDTMSGGMEIVYNNTDPLVSVVTEVEQAYTTEVEYETEYEYSDELYEDEKEVIQEGVNGYADVVEIVTMENGEEVYREEIERVVTEEPQNEIIRKGTLERPEPVEEESDYEEPDYDEPEDEEADYDEPEDNEDEVTEGDNSDSTYEETTIVQEVQEVYDGGSLSWPLSGTVSYGFGPRVAPTYGASTFHEGIDICADYGTPIYAAASGTCTGNTGWYGGYGLAVVIDHGNGMKTVYGHMSSMVVSAGTYVERGQLIGYVGSTGVASCNHCHFEVVVNGTAVDPYSYLS